MGKTLYLECYSGISGDMTAAALLDLGADREVLEKALKSLPVQGFTTRISKVTKSGIAACDFDVILDKEYENHDHDMEYLHGHSHHGHSHDHADSHADVHGHSHDHADDHGHSHHSHSHDHADDHGHSHHSHSHDHDHAAMHDHSHDHGHDHAGTHSHAHVHRGMKDIREIIQGAQITDRARELALSIFSVLARAEAKAHNVPVEEVHFHEVGAVDSIVDILSVAVCLDDLDVTEVIIPELCEGRGTVRCQHGILPIPVPAVSNIISDSGMKLKITEVQGELVTPTGAAIAAALCTGNRLPGSFSIERIGIGAGKRQYECPGILRAMLIRPAEKEESIVKLETNIDDCTGEALGFVMEKLLAAGARDVNYMPVFMKKNRPAWLLTVICMEDSVELLQNIIFRETTSIGIRRIQMERTILKREQRVVETPLGQAQVKVCSLEGSERFYPEYESIRKLCEETGRSYQEVSRMVLGSCGKANA